MTKLGVKKGETVFIHGIGGGVALYALQIASAIGALPIVSSGNQDKLVQAVKLGAVHGVDYRNEDVSVSVQSFTQGRGVDAVVDGVGQLGLSMSLCRVGGRVANYGTTNYAEPLTQINGAILHSRHISLLGTSMNTQAELSDAIAFAHHSKLFPVIHEMYEFERAGAAFDVMKRAEQFGKLVVRIK